MSHLFALSTWAAAVWGVRMENNIKQTTTKMKEGEKHLKGKKNCAM